MSDCSNAEMRDLLPDLLHDRLDSADRARVEAHVASCAECASELALLRTALHVTSARVPTVDVAAIVRRLPAAPVRQSSSPSSNVVSIDEARRVRAARRPMRVGGWRQAAAVAAIVVGGAAAVVLGRGRDADVAPIAPGAVAQSTPAVTGAPVAGSTVPDARSATAPSATNGTGALALAGGVSDLSDDALVSLIGDIDSLDRAPDVEPAALLPNMTGETGE